jgi:WD40 repeat protein
MGPIGLVLATAGLTTGLSASSRCGQSLLFRTRPVQRLSLPRMSDDDATSGDDGPPGPSKWDLSVLQQRMAKRQVADMVTAASNWRTGTCEQRTVLVLEDWVRRVRCENGVLACGTYSGEVVLSDVASGQVLQRWEPEDGAAEDEDHLLEYGGEDGEEEEGEEEDDEDEDRSEVTALDFDGTHLASGHASGAVYLRDGERCVMRGELAGVVTGVHWNGGPTAYTCSSDRRLAAWDVAAGKPSFSLTASRPVLCMSVCEGYAALGLDDGSVCVCTLSPLRQLFTFVAHDAPVSAVKLVTVSQVRGVFLVEVLISSAPLWRMTRPSRPLS